MEQPQANGQILHFGAFEVDSRAGELRKGGRKVKLQDQPFQILTLLLEHPGEVVTREDIQKKLWPTDTFVDFEHSLNTAVTKLRQALGDDADNPRFVETLPRRGYRFVGTLNGNQPSAQSPSPSQTPAPQVTTVSEPAQALAPPSAIPPPTRSRPLHIWLAATVLAIVAIFVFLIAARLFNFSFNTTTTDTPPAPPHIESIAVLPLDNLSGDPAEEYFVDGMTDLLINDLSKISALRVISRTSVMQYKGARKPLPEIGRELNVDAIIEGAVLRSGNRVRITAQLLDAQTEKPLWAETYEHDLSDVFKLQSEVAQSISSQVMIKVTPQEQQRLAAVPPSDPEAQEDYFKGRYYENRAAGIIAQPAPPPSISDDLKESVKFFQKAIAKAPGDALAFAGLASSYCRAVDFSEVTANEGYGKARDAALKALSIDDSLASAHESLAEVLWLKDWDWSGAEKEFKRAIELSPSNPVAHAWYARYLGELARTDEALAQIEIARRIDPNSSLVGMFRGVVLSYARRYDDAIAQFKKLQDQNPNGTTANFYLMACYERKGMFNESVSLNLRNKQITGTNPAILGTLRDAYTRDGIRGWWRAEIDTSEAQGWRNDCNLASLYALLGDKQNALDSLEHAYAKRGEIDCPYLRSLKANAVFDGLRAEPRFQTLEAKIGLLPN